MSFIFPQGMDSGFAGGEDEIYNVYDQAWRGGKDMAQSIYRPSKNLDKDMYGDDLEARIKTNRYQDKTVQFHYLYNRTKLFHSPFSCSLDLFLTRNFLVLTAREAEKDLFSLKKILLVWTSFWKKPNSMVALKDPQIAAAPRNMSMKARRGGKNKSSSLQSERTILSITLMMQVMGGLFVNGQEKTKSGY